MSNAILWIFLGVTFACVSLGIQSQVDKRRKMIRAERMVREMTRTTTR